MTAYVPRTRHLVRAVVILGCLVAALGNADLLDTTSAATSITFTPAADAYVDSSSPTTNFGTSTQLRVDGSPTVRSFLRFNVQGLSGPVASAVLRVYANSSQTAGYTAYQVANNTWGETSINYGNAPALGASIGSSGAVSSGTWTSLNVTSYITGNGTWSLALATSSATALSLASRESGANAPQLVITPAAAPTPTNTATATQTQAAAPTSTLTNTPASIPTSTAANTNTSTPIPTNTNTPTSSATPTDTSAPSSTPTGTATNTPTNAVAPTPTDTATPASIPSPTATPTDTTVAAATDTLTATPTSAATATPTNTPAMPVVPSVTFVPIADSYVSSSNPTVNYGTSTQIRIDGSPITNSYLRFSVSGLSGTVTSATLRIYANSSLSAGYEVHRVADNTWGETTINYSNAPAFGGTVNTSGAVTTGSWNSVDVTSYVAGNGTFSFGLMTTSSTALSMASRESGANAPQLVIQLSSAPTPTNSSTPASGTATNTPTPTNTPITTPTSTPSATPTPTPVSAPTPTATAFSGGDPVIVTAGDIACDPANSNFNGGNGTSQNCRMLYTSNLILNINPAAVLPLGDNQYYCGGYAAFQQSYDQSWGRVFGITHPAVGNHEYLTSGGTGCDSTNTGAAGYFKYFGAAAGSPSQGYYSFDIGAWHLIALNSSCSSAGGCGSTSPQGQWLAADLAAHPNKCTLAYWHIPVWSSGGRASSNMKTLTQILYDNNADVVLTAHDHDYERFAPQNPQGQLDTARGIRAFVVGTGGANHTSFTTVFPNSQVRNDTTFGVLKLTLHASSYDWQFVPESGATFTDSGTTACH